MIKLLHITNTDARFDSRILKELESLTNLKEYDYELMVYGIQDIQYDTYNNLKIQYIRTFRLVTKKLNFLPRSILYPLIFLESILRLTIPTLKYRPNVIHCHDTLFLPIALVFSFFCKSKLIYDAHELESQKNSQSKWMSRATLYIEKISWKYIDVLISVSPSIIDWYQKYLGAKKSLLILNSPQINTESYNSTSNNYLRKKYNISDNSKVFIYIGILGRGRGIDLYLNVFQSLEINSHLIFLGYGDYLTKIQESSLNYRNIHYHPAVNHDEVVIIARSADVGLAMIEPLSLSDYFCLPNKLFEYAFSGLFVLTSDFPDMKKVIIDFELGMVCSFDYESFKKAVNDIENIRLEKSTKDLYELSWNRQSDKLINLYKDIIVN
jgi:glycosyltransferase involved in cell wall biosynthesis